MLLIKYINNYGKFEEEYKLKGFFFFLEGRNISFPKDAFIQLSHVEHTSSKFGNVRKVSA